MIASPIADSAPATAIIYNPKTSAKTSLNCQEKNNVITETANKIISMEIIINMRLFLLKTNPIAPKPNKTKAKSIINYFFLLSLFHLLIIVLIYYNLLQISNLLKYTNNTLI